MACHVAAQEDRCAMHAAPIAETLAVELQLTVMAHRLKESGMHVWEYFATLDSPIFVRRRETF